MRHESTIFAYTNATVWTNGYLMLGYADPYGGTGAQGFDPTDILVRKAEGLTDTV